MCPSHVTKSAKVLRPLLSPKSQVCLFFRLSAFYFISHNWKSVVFSSQRGFPNTLSGQMSESCVWLLSVMSKSLLVGQSKSVLSQVRGQVWLSISKSKQSSLMCLFIIRVHHMPPAALVPIFGVCRAGHFLAFPLPNHLLRARPSIGAGVDQDLSHPCLPPRSARL